MTFKISILPEMEVFRQKENYLARDILKLGFETFNFEKEIKKSKEYKFELNISLTLPTFIKIDENKINNILNSLYKEILNINVNVKITSIEYKFKSTKKKSNFKNNNIICLFSGGVDSFFGIFEANKIYKNLIGVSVAHSDQSGMINIVKKIIEGILKDNNISSNLIYAPSITTSGYSQFRGFLYILSAGAFSEINKANKILITECGTTMYQPKFSPYDSVTSTTHPLILSSAKEILKELRNEKIELITPFEDMTKAEIIACSNHTQYLPITHSCISARFRNNCGLCYGCVLRRLGSLLVGVKDSDYAYDILADEEVDKDNLLSLVRFSYFFIFERDKLPNYSIDKIIKYNKEELFNRQSLDVLATLYLLKKESFKFSETVNKIYNIYIKDISPKILEKRIEIVRKKTKKPNFKKKVPDLELN